MQAPVPDETMTDGGEDVDAGPQCPRGFFWEEDAGCADIDECEAHVADGCDFNATCTNTTGSFTCTCLPDWYGDGGVCERGFRVLTAGARHACALMFGGSVSCWGFNATGAVGDGTTQWRPSPSPVADAGLWAAVGSAGPGASHHCGVRVDGSLWCWGANAAGQLGNGETVNQLGPNQVGTERDWKQISGAQRSSCGLKTDGRIFCWGDNMSGELGLPASSGRRAPAQFGTASNWSQVLAGTLHFCAITNTGSIFCWGDNSFAQRGNGAVMAGTTVARVGMVDEWAFLGTTGFGGCGLKKTGELWCWGRNQLGQVNPSSVALQFAVPQRVGSAVDWAAVTGGADHACALKRDGRVFCWGSNQRGQAGGSVFASHQTSAQVASDVYVAVAAGEDFTCALRRDNTAWCWGNNTDGQLGQGRLGLALLPRRVDNVANWAEVTLGSAHTCARKEEGTLWCWGAGGQGQLGAGNFESRAAPSRVGAEIGWTAVSAGAAHTCGIRGGALYCWGDNAEGQVGDGTFDNLRPTLTQVGTATDWTAVSCGGFKSCALKAAGTLWCWGSNAYGQTGTASLSTRVVAPRQVGTATDWVSLSAGFGHGCARKIDSSLWCWGSGLQGELGQGNQSSTNAPVRVGAGSDWASVSAGLELTCGVAAGALRCWGFNGEGVTGTGLSTAVVTTPTAVGPGATWVGVGVGTRAACASQLDGTVWCWGSARRGVLGTGGLTSAQSPVLISLAQAMQSPRMGSEHACAVTATGGALWCWGENSSGQLGDGAGFQSQPVEVRP